MAFTVTTLNDLEKAIGSGARRIQYQDREVDLRTQKDMLALRRLIRKDLGLDQPKSRRLGSSYSKGLD